MARGADYITDQHGYDTDNDNDNTYGDLYQDTRYNRGA